MQDRTTPRPRRSLPVTARSGRTVGRTLARSAVRLALLGTLSLGAGGALWACSSSLSGGEELAERTLIAVTISPVNDVIEVDLNQELTRKLSVFAIYGEGATEDVTAEVNLKLSNAAVGRVEGTTLFIAPHAQNGIEFAQLTTEITRNGKTVSGVANVTVVWLRKSGPQQDFFFALPYNGTPQMKPLDFSTNIRSLDTFFAVDTTASMRFEIEQLGSSLQTRIIPGVKQQAVNDAWFGVGAVEDFPYSAGFFDYGLPNHRTGFGLPDDQPFILAQEMTADVMAAQLAVNSMLVTPPMLSPQPRGDGRDLPEAQLEALYQIATGAGLMSATLPALRIPANNKGIGGVNFRKGSQPIVALITDTMFHTKGEPTKKCSGFSSTSGNPVDVFADYAGPVAPITHSRSETLAALNKICAKVIGISALLTSPNAGFRADPNGLCNANSDLLDAARATGAIVPPAAWDVTGRPAACAAGKCCTGLDGASEDPGPDGMCPLVFKIRQSGAGLGDQVVTGISQVSRFASFDVKTEVSGLTADVSGQLMLPAGKSTADFVKSVSPLSATAPPPAGSLMLPGPMISGSAFTRVYPGSQLQFQVSTGNDMVLPIDRPQVFHATIKVLAGGCAELDQRDVIVLIPPRDPRIG
jgi:hypothetical protein